MKGSVSLRKAFMPKQLCLPAQVERFRATACLKLAEEQSVDLIIIGSHGRHGLALLLGSTANAVLHHAKIDVLAVRVGNS